jgi:hypothetical protein
VDREADPHAKSTSLLRLVPAGVSSCNVEWKERLTYQSKIRIIATWKTTTLSQYETWEKRCLKVV